jgi:hypothetical protein
VAQEFGDHPDTAILRMQWARHAVEEAFVPATGPGAVADTEYAAA